MFALTVSGSCPVLKCFNLITQICLDHALCGGQANLEISTGNVISDE